MSNDDIVPGFDDTQIDGLHVRLSKAGEPDGCLVVSLKGDLGQQWGGVFQKRVSKAIGAGYLRLVFDLGELGYLSEDAGYPFADFLATVRHRGGDVVLVDIQPKVYKVLQIIGSSQLFNYMDGLEEAIAFCSGTSWRAPRGNDVIAPGFDDGRDECLKIRLHGVAGHPGGLLLSLTGYLDNSTSANVMNRITRAIDAGYLRLIFDMDGIDFMNNDGAGVLTAVLEAVKQHGGDIVLIRTPPKVREVLRILGCLPSLPIRKTFAEGIAYFSGRPEAAVDGNDVMVPGFPDAACENLEIRMRGLE
jgi:anti-sigma B factor antagonist